MDISTPQPDANLPIKSRDEKVIGGDNPDVSMATEKPVNFSRAANPFDKDSLTSQGSKEQRSAPIYESTAEKPQLPTPLSSAQINNQPPVSSSAVEDPKLYNAEQLEVFKQSVMQIIDSTEKAATKTAQDLGTDKSYIDIYSHLLEVLTWMKEVLATVQVPTSERSEEIYKSKIDQADMGMKSALLSIQKSIEEAKEKSKGGPFEWLSVGLSALAVVVAIAAAVVTGGGSLAIVALVVSSVMLAYTVSDKMGAGITESIVKAIQDMSPALQAIVLTVLVAVIVAVMCTSLGAGAVGASEIALGAGEQIALQFSIQMLLASQVIPNLVIEACIGMGLDPKDTETINTIKLIVSIVSTIVLTLVVGVKMARAAKGASVVPNKDVANAASKAVENFIKTKIDGAIYLKAVRGMLPSLDQLKGMPAALWQNIKTFFPDVWSGLKTLISKPNNPLETVMRVQTAIQLSENVVNIANASIMCNIYFKVEELEREIGDSEKATQLYQLLSKLYQALLNLLQGSQGELNEFIRALTAAVESVNTSYSEAVRQDVRG